MAAASLTADESRSSQPKALWQRLLGLAFGSYKAVLSPVFHAVAPSRCLYLPTCSEYAYVSISRFGVARGSWMALRRFARCHPWGRGGLDPVPDACAHTTHADTEAACCKPKCGPSDQLS
jgi:putative membrane protein insertion efficiency factor